MIGAVNMKVEDRTDAAVRGDVQRVGAGGREEAKKEPGLVKVHALKREKKGVTNPLAAHEEQAIVDLAGRGRWDLMKHGVSIDHPFLDAQRGTECANGNVERREDMAKANMSISGRRRLLDVVRGPIDGGGVGEAKRLRTSFERTANRLEKGWVAVARTR